MIKRIGDIVFLVFLLLHVTGIHQLQAKTIRVGTALPVTNLSDAAQIASPGDTIHFLRGVYSGGQSIANLQGNASKWITLFARPSDSVIIRGGHSAWQFTDVAYLNIEGFIFEDQTANGINIDDGGTYDTPSHHVIFKSCVFRNIKATGNNDLLKISGLDHFSVVSCIFLNGSPGGSGIDMVGCHHGVIESSEFNKQGSNSIQAKGGSQFIRIQRNKFMDGGQRSVNLGGSTGLPFFRPQDAQFEAADLEVFSNVFVGSDSPVAFVGCIRSKVINNTFYLPQRWVVRILQENTNPRFLPCGENTFENNLIYYSQLRSETNIGPNTRPETFRFSSNFWFDSAASEPKLPLIPVNDVVIVIGQNPLFTDADSGDFRLKKGSPALGKIQFTGEPVTDFHNKPFKKQRAFGAIEYEEHE